MFQIILDKNRLTVQKNKEPLTSGSVNVYVVRFRFSCEWDGFDKVAVFQNGSETVNVSIIDNQCTVPWEVLTIPNRVVHIGVYGVKGTEQVLPTVWGILGGVLQGTELGSINGQTPTPSIYQKLLDALEQINQDFKDTNDHISELDADYLERINQQNDYIQNLQQTMLKPVDVNYLVEQYLIANPPEATIPNSQIQGIVDEYLESHPPVASTESIQTAVNKYLSENQVGITEARVQEMIDSSVGVAINTAY